MPVAASAQGPGGALPAAAEGQPVPEKVRAWLDLMSDPQVRDFLQKQLAGAGGAAPANDGKVASSTATGFLSARVDAVQERMSLLAHTLPTLPAELVKARERFRGSFVKHSPAALFLLIGLLTLAGIGLAFLVKRRLAGVRHVHLAQDPADGLERARHHLVRFIHHIAGVAAFALGAFGGLVFFDLPPVPESVVVALLMAVLVTHGIMKVGRFLLEPPGPQQAPQPERLRLLPVDDESAAFWQRRLTVFGGFFAFGYALIDILAHLALPRPVLLLTAFGFGLGLLAIAIETTLRRPPRNKRRGIIDWLVVASLVLLWAVWVAGGSGPFWVLLYLAFLPKTVVLAGEIARRITQGPQSLPAERLPALGQDGTVASEAEVDAESRPVQTPGGPGASASIGAVIVERGARAFLLVLAALWLSRMLGIDLEDFSVQDDLVTRLARGVVSGIVIFFIADFVWHLARVMIDRKLAESGASPGLTPEEFARRGRLRTLLPILRNVILAFVCVTALLMILSSIGIEIGPLIAGAGVVGIAVGFGSQMLVRDILSGVFYMLDDAFRVGEYIQSGNYKGTVESFSLRSVKLRHHRGPVYTVPFGQLGAVQNMSRDWVIEKFVVRVGYDTDIAKVKKLVKAIGKELKDNPEFGPHIIETLKMQGVDAFGEFAIELRFKMMTKPGEQFAIRRHAFGLIIKAFNENGIRFALPTVHVSGGREEDEAAAAAKTVLEPAQSPGTAAASS